MTDEALFSTAPAVALMSAAAVSFARYAAMRARGPVPSHRPHVARQRIGDSRPWKIGLAGLALVHVLIVLPAFLPVFLTGSLSGFIPGLLPVPPGPDHSPPPIRSFLLNLLWHRGHAQVLTLEAIAFALGILALIGLLSLVARTLRGSGRHGAEVGGSELSPGARSPRAGPATHTGDTVVLAVLFVQIVSGLLMALRYRWASSWAAVTLAPYVRSLLTTTPNLSLIAGMPYLVKLHVFCTFVLLAALPFSRALDLVLAPIDRLLTRGGARVAAPALQVRHRLGCALDEIALRGASALSLGREED